jgi:hypothetical protein
MREDPTILTQVSVKLGKGVVLTHNMKLSEAMEVTVLLIIKLCSFLTMALVGGE